jgi:predicted amidohydrolase
MTAPLDVAILAFSASADIRANAARIAAALAEAAPARLLLTPECALIGYPGAARSGCADIDWCLVADEEERLEAAAVRAGVVLVLGSASQLSSAESAESMASATPAQRGAASRPVVGNDAVVLGAGRRPLRYRKRSLTPQDREHFAPGSGGACLFALAGWRLALSVCFELRFGALWAEQAAAGADAFLSLAHMAGSDPDPGTKAAVIPQLYAARAAEWATPLLLANTADPARWLDSGLWDARGMRVASRAEGVLRTTITPRERLDPWYARLRDEALAQAGALRAGGRRRASGTSRAGGSSRTGGTSRASGTRRGGPDGDGQARRARRPRPG